MTYPIPRASIWPNVVFNTSSAKGMAAAQAWMASHVPEGPVEPRTGENDTQTHEDTQTATQRMNAEGFFMLCHECLAVIVSDRQDEHQQWHDRTDRPTEAK